MYDNVGGLILQLIASLAIIIGLIVLLVKLLAMRSRWLNRHRPVKVLGGIGLGAQKSLQIVEIGGVLYVLGVGHDVTLLRVIDDPEERARIEQQFAGAHESASSFTWFKQFGKRQNESHQQHFSSLLTEQLDRVRTQREEVLHDWINEDDDRERKSNS